MGKFLRSARVPALALVTALAVAACSSAGTPTPGAGSPTPRRGGSVTLGGFTFAQLDPGQAGYIAGANPYMTMVYGSLFAQPAKVTDPYAPGLATGYTFNTDSTSLTIKLRENVKFADGTPFNADAVLWNFKRYANPQSTNNQYFTTVTNMVADNDHQVTLTFSQPNAPIIAAMATGASGYMSSPTAFNSMGAAKFATNPVGAGPFKVTSSVASQSLGLQRNDDYWDAAHVYLDKVTFKNTGTDDSVQYTDLLSNSIQQVVYTGILSAPAVIAQAKANKNINVVTSPDVLYLLLPINTFKAPFDKLEARQAVAYCTDRDVIAKSVQQGFANPAYILSGTDGQYLPSGGAAATKSSYPYPYDTGKGKALVDQLGGLAFEVTVYTVQGQTLATALQQQWADCGIKATVKNVPPQTFLTNLGQGNYQMGLTNTGGSANPQLWTSYQNPLTPIGKYGFKDQNITDLIHQSAATTDEAKLTELWGKIWAAENQLAVDLPLLSSGRYIAYSKCMSGVELHDFGADITHAFLTC